MKLTKFFFIIDRYYECRLGKDKVRHAKSSRYFGSLTRCLGTVVGRNPLFWDTGPMWYSGYHNFPFPGFLKYLYTEKAEKKGEQLGELHADWPGQDFKYFLTWALGLVTRHANHCTTETLGCRLRLFWKFRITKADEILRECHWQVGTVHVILCLCRKFRDL